MERWRGGYNIVEGEGKGSVRWRGRWRGGKRMGVGQKRNIDHQKTNKELMEKRICM